MSARASNRARIRVVPMYEYWPTLPLKPEYPPRPKMWAALGLLAAGRI